MKRQLLPIILFAASVLILVWACNVDARESARIVVYTQDGCAPCHELMRTLRKRGISFTECNTSRSQQCEREFLQLGGEYTPLITKNGKVVGLGAVK